ncbi:MAG TPA: hypothetical protein EYN89_02780 [Flavobacteriales bacterium]|nr:hypothetical protein [Flavobacteriales bacterium]
MKTKKEQKTKEEKEDKIPYFEILQESLNKVNPMDKKEAVAYAFNLAVAHPNFRVYTSKVEDANKLKITIRKAEIERKADKK